jgi:RIO-like serine/threonine protein kinase
MATDIKNTGLSKDFVKDVVMRTIKSKIEEINQKLTDINNITKYFEKKYGMNNEEFYKKFLEGSVGDDMDFFEWKASCDLHKELQEEKEALLEAIG